MILPGVGLKNFAWRDAKYSFRRSRNKSAVRTQTVWADEWTGSGMFYEVAARKTAYLTYYSPYRHSGTEGREAHERPLP